jgi:hypothetical protein
MEATELSLEQIRAIFDSAVSINDEVAKLLAEQQQLLSTLFHASGRGLYKHNGLYYVIYQRGDRFTLTQTDSQGKSLAKADGATP